MKMITALTVAGLWLIPIAGFGDVPGQQDSGDRTVVAPSAPRSPGLHALYYWDSRKNNTLSLFYSSRNLPHGLVFWGFTDFDSAQHSSAQQYDLSLFFTEARLARMFGHGFGIQAEYNGATGAGNDVGRVGAVFKFPLKRHFLMLRVFPLETDGDGGQLSAVWRLRIRARLMFEGFVDYNVREGRADRIVFEPQVRFMFTQQLGLVLEYRLNEFLRGTSRDDKGAAFGLYYDF